MAEKTEKKPKKKEKNIVATRGRSFQGVVTKKFPGRVVIEFEKTVYIPKYESYTKRKTRLHARIPEHLEVNLGDFVKIQETRPLSKIIHFIVTEIVSKVEIKDLRSPQREAPQRSEEAHSKSETKTNKDEVNKND